MQKSDLHEKQVLLLTDDNPAIEEALEQQLRELNAVAAEYQIPERRALSEGRRAQRGDAYRHPLCDGATAVFAAADPRGKLLH